MPAPSEIDASLAHTPEGKLVEIKVSQVHANPEEAARALNTRAGGLKALSNTAFMLGFVDAGIAILSFVAKSGDNRVSGFVAGAAGFAVSGGVTIVLDRRADHAHSQAASLRQRPAELPTLAMPQKQAGIK